MIIFDIISPLEPIRKNWLPILIIGLALVGIVVFTIIKKKKKK